MYHLAEEFCCPRCGCDRVMARHDAVIWQEITLVGHDFEYEKFDFDAIDWRHEMFVCGRCDHEEDDWTVFVEDPERERPSRVIPGQLQLQLRLAEPALVAGDG